jgi:hypothetical protein
MPQILLDPKETLGGVPSDTTLAWKILGEASSLRNGLLFSKLRRPLKINKSYWINDYFRPERVKVSVLLYLSTLKKLLRGKYVRKASKYLPFPINKMSRLQTVVPVMPPKKQAKWATSDLRYEAFIESEHNRTAERNGVEFLMFKPNGGWEFTRPHLLRFTDSNVGSLSTEKILNIIDKNSDKWMIPLFDFLPAEKDIDKQFVNPDAYSGFWTSHLFGTVKRESVAASNVIAKCMYNMIRSRFVVNTSLITLGGRDKVVKSKDLGKVTVSRVVMQEETPITQLKQIFARPITKAYQALNKVKIREHGIGIDFLGVGWKLFCDKLIDLGSYVLVGDVVSSDYSIREDVLLMAFSILSAHYPDSKELERFFFFFANGHVYKRVILPGGFVYLLPRGIQSGCAFTAHLNTIVTRIMLLCIIDELKIRYHTLVTYGDDWLIFLLQRNVDVVKIEEVVYRILGIRLKDVSFGAIDNGSFEQNALTFLKTGSYNSLPGRLLKEVIKKLQFSEKYSRLSNSNLHEVLSGMFLYSFGNHKASAHIISYIRYAYEHDTIYADYLVDKMLRINSKVYLSGISSHYISYYKDIYFTNAKRYYAKAGIYGVACNNKKLFNTTLINIILGWYNKIRNL